MQSRWKLLLLFVFSVFNLAPQQSVWATGLDRYVAKPDSAYTYRYLGEKEDIFSTSYFLSMTSQQWRSATEVDRPLWEHDVSITVPRTFSLDKTSTAIVVVEGGSNGDAPSQAVDDIYNQLALFTRSVVIVVHQVPNQPLRFFEDSRASPRSEDAIIAYSDRKFLDSCSSDGRGCDWQWPVQVAMVKAVVRTMDTATTFLAQQGVHIGDFVVTGVSKRAWATWLTAAVDPRVRGIIPVSFDILNIEQQAARIWAAYDGQYPPAFVDYTALDLFCKAQGNASGRRLYEIVDPFYYRDRLTMPKLIVNSTGDEFYLPDGSQQYYAQLPGDNRLRYTFNTDHAQLSATEDILLGAGAWINDIKAFKAPPKYTWEVRDSKIVVNTSEPAKSVAVWRATDARQAQTRDFRLESLGPAWGREILLPVSTNRYEAAIPSAAAGTWVAQSVEVEFEKPSPFLDTLPDVVGIDLLPQRQVFTTDVVIRPRRLPREPDEHCSSSEHEEDDKEAKN